jgi:hypothetical protein
MAKTNTYKSKITKKSGFTFRWWMAVVLVVFIALVGIVVVRLSHAGTGVEVVQVASATELGPLQNSDTRITGRDGGITGMVGSQPFWTFGDTFYDTSAITDKADILRSLTGGYGSVSDPVKVVDAAVARTTPPTQVVPYTQAELTNNKQPNHTHTFVNWPAGVIPIDANNSYIFFNHYIFDNNHNATAKSNGVAKLESGKYVATRIVDNLFKDHTLQYQFKEGSTIYLTACYQQPVTIFITSPCSLGRVNYTAVTDQTQYSWWDGKVWQSDITKAQPIFDASTWGVSINYNPFLKKYTAIYSNFYAPNSVMMRVADSPQGPWSDKQEIYQLPPTTKSQSNYAVYNHPEFDPTGKTLYVSYLFGDDNKIHLAQITLANPTALSISFPEKTVGAALSQTTQSGSTVQPCNIQKGFFSNKDYRGCNIAPSTSLTITSDRFGQFVNAANIQICVASLNSDQAPFTAELTKNGTANMRFTMRYGSAGLSKILACGSVAKPTSFDGVEIVNTTQNAILVNKLTITPQ